MELHYLVDTNTGRAHLARNTRRRLERHGILLPHEPTVEEVEEALEIAALGEIDRADEQTVAEHDRMAKKPSNNSNMPERRETDK